MTFRCGLEVHFSDENPHGLVPIESALHSGDLLRCNIFWSKVTTEDPRESAAEVQNTENGKERNFKRPRPPSINSQTLKGKKRGFAWLSAHKGLGAKIAEMFKWKKRETTLHTYTLTSICSMCTELVPLGLYRLQLLKEQLIPNCSRKLYRIMSVCDVKLNITFITLFDTNYCPQRAMSNSSGL